jgi:uncharacterized protein (TIGR03437 family)
MRFLYGPSVVFLLVLSAPRLGATVLSISSASAGASESVTLNIDIDGQGRPAGLQWTLTYPSQDLVSATVEAGPAATAADKTVQCEEGSGSTTCIAIGFNDNVIGAGAVARVTFLIAVTPTSRFAVVDMDQATGVDPEGKVIPVQSLSGNVTFTMPGAEALPETFQNGVLNAATSVQFPDPSHPPAAGSIISIFGQFGGQFDKAAAVPLPIALGGISVTLDGVPVPLFAVLPGEAFDQINGQMPWSADAESGVATLVVSRDGEPGPPREILVAPASPGIYTFQFGPGPAIVQNLDGTFAQPTDSLGDQIPARPAPAGGIIIVWSNGLGPVDPPVDSGDIPDGPLPETEKTVKLFIGGVQAEILGKPILHPSLVALNQLNATVPASLAPADQVPIEIEVDCGDGKVFRSRSDVFIAIGPAP